MTVPGHTGVHPLFLYESLWNLLGLVLLRLLIKRRKYNGQMFTVYIAWYGLGRGLMEGMRAAEYNLMLGNMLISQVIAIVSCIAALILLFYMTLFRKNRPLLAWTAERDEYEERRKQRKENRKSNEATENEIAEVTEEEGLDNGSPDGRESAGEDSQE
jgi:prolipoprotein diacylglyceryltransferase